MCSQLADVLERSDGRRHHKVPGAAVSRCQGPTALLIALRPHRQTHRLLLSASSRIPVTRTDKAGMRPALRPTGRVSYRQRLASIHSRLILEAQYRAGKAKHRSLHQGSGIAEQGSDSACGSGSRRLCGSAGSAPTGMARQVASILLIAIHP